MSLAILRQAEELASRAQMRYQHCCLIATSRGQILAQGFNRPIRGGGNRSRHAEVDAIKCYQGN